MKNQNCGRKYEKSKLWSKKSLSFNNVLKKSLDYIYTPISGKIFENMITFVLIFGDMTIPR